MGLFDKIKGAVVNAAGVMKQGYAEASVMGPEQLCDVMMDMKKLDPKMLAYKQALRDKCSAMSDEDLERFYTYIKREGGIFKTHPGQEAVESVLVQKNLYIRNEDGTLTKNSKFRFFK